MQSSIRTEISALDQTRYNWSAFEDERL